MYKVVMLVLQIETILITVMF